MHLVQLEVVPISTRPAHTDFATRLGQVARAQIETTAPICFALHLSPVKVGQHLQVLCRESFASFTAVRQNHLSPGQAQQVTGHLVTQHLLEAEFLPVAVPGECNGVGAHVQWAVPG